MKEYKLVNGALYKNNVLLCNVSNKYKTLECAVNWWLAPIDTCPDETNYEQQEINYLQSDY